MILVLVASALALLALPALLAPLGRQLPPHDRARFGWAALLLGAALVELSFILIALPVLLEAVGAARLADVCRHVLGELPGSSVPSAGWLAAILAVASLVRAFSGWHRARGTQRAMYVEGCVGVHESTHDHDVVVLPCASPLALSIPGSPPQVILSEGLVQSLSPDQLRAVVNHERAHLNHGHARHLRVVSGLRSAFWYLPLVRRSVDCLHTALERWADEEAAGGTEQGRMEVRDALLRVTAVSVDAGVAAFAPLETVFERIGALESPCAARSVKWSAMAFAPVVLLSATAALSLSAWAHPVRALLSGLCAA